MKLLLITSIFLLIIIPLSLFSLSQSYNVDSLEEKILSPLAAPLKKAIEVLSANSPSDLEQIVQNELTGSKGIYAFVIQDLKSGKSYAYNQDRIFETASLYKLWVMAVAFEQMEEGRLRENQMMKDDIAKLNERFDIATESAEKTEGEISLSVNEAIEKMITISHNYAALLLSSRVRLANVKTFLKSEGFENSNVGTPPKTTAQDMADFFEKLYKGEIVSATSSARMINILKEQEINDRIPKYLPDETTVAHKTGELGKFKHDAGIVFSPKRDYIFVALSESNDPKGATERIANLSKSVYEYFNSPLRK